MRLKPRFGMKAGISSGDNPRSNSLGTFNPLFPIGNYFGVNHSRFGGIQRGNQPILASGRPLDSAKAVVILVHGRGASAEDILGLADELNHPEFAFLAPDAAGNSWYPYFILAPIPRNQTWLDSALNFVGKVVERAVAACVPRNKVALVGFSQGACLATEFVARNASRYDALVAFTGGLIRPPGTSFNYPGDLQGTPCFFGAGDPDPHVAWERVQESASVFYALGGAVSLQRYPGMSHTINQDEIAHANQLLSRLSH